MISIKHATLRSVDNLKWLILMKLQLHTGNEGASNSQEEYGTKIEEQILEIAKTFTEEEFSNKL